jgi:ubiquitin C-terminal hydrolase
MELSLNLLLSDHDSELANSLVPDLMGAIDSLKNLIDSKKGKLACLQSSIKQVFDEKKQTKYHLHAVFMHEGEASYGHYWIYLWDKFKNRWIKFNDSVVSQVPDSIVYQNTSGKNANVYALAYLRVQ